MAKPLEFEYVVRCKDPEKTFQQLLEAPPSAAALDTLKRAEKLYSEGLKLGLPQDNQADAG